MICNIDIMAIELKPINQNELHADDFRQLLRKFEDFGYIKYELGKKKPDDYSPGLLKYVK
jgi:hypothetical protein